MYHHSEFDRAFVVDRAARFRDQVNRLISGALTEDEFRPLRLMNGVYLQLHAYMLRVAIPYGSINPDQMRQLAMIADRWDKGYGHFTTRQNIQYNWPKLVDIPDMLDALAEVGMHAIQTSGNTIRNVTADHFAGAAADEIADPRAYAELIRQWSTDHPEFQFLPRKFKIAITGSPNDRAVTKAHDIGLRMVRNAAGEPGFEVMVGGGLGRTPMIAFTVRDFLPVADLLPYVEAVLSVYNILGRRDNKYKARIKITVHETGRDEIARMIEERFLETRPQFGGADQALLDDIRAAFAPPAFRNAPTDTYDAFYKADPVFRAWVDTNLAQHRNDQYAIVTISVKAHGETPGDATSAQMRVMADLAEQYGHGDLRISHEQNVILPHVHKSDLPAVHAALAQAGLGTANIGLGRGQFPVARQRQPVGRVCQGHFQISPLAAARACQQGLQHGLAGHQRAAHVGVQRGGQLGAGHQARLGQVGQIVPGFFGVYPAGTHDAYQAQARVAGVQRGSV